MKNLMDLGTIIGGFSTFIYTILTIRLILETRNSRKLQESPQIDLYIERDPSWDSMLNIIIKNNGFTGAYDLKLETNIDFEIFKGKENYTLRNMGYFKNGISYLPPKGERQSTFTFLDENYEEKIRRKIIIKAKYKNQNGKLKENVFLIDLSQFENTILPQENPLYKISRSLESLKDDINNIATGYHKLQIITQSKLNKIKEEKRNN